MDMNIFSEYTKSHWILYSKRVNDVVSELYPKKMWKICDEYISEWTNEYRVQLLILFLELLSTMDY